LVVYPAHAWSPVAAHSAPLRTDRLPDISKKSGLFHPMNLYNMATLPRSLLLLKSMARRKPSYIGKRSVPDVAPPPVNGDVEHSGAIIDESKLFTDKRRVPGFVGKRARMFVGKREDDGYADDNKRARMFIGKRTDESDDLSNLENEYKRARFFVGKKDMSDAEKRARMFVGKRARMYIGKKAFAPRQSRLWVGKHFANDEEEKRARMFIGKKSRAFVGKRAQDDNEDKRGGNRMFVGKKSDDEMDSLYDELDKRARMFVGKRRLFVGKRQDDDDKRARFFVGRRSELDSADDKRARMFIGKRFDDEDESIMDDEDKRARMFVGKRSLPTPQLSDNEDIQDASYNRAISKRSILPSDALPLQAATGVDVAKTRTK